MSESIQPEEFGRFKIPPSLLEKLYDFTGDSAEQSKGFILAYGDQDGNPMIISKAGSNITDMGLRKALEKYLIEIEGVDTGYDVDRDKE